MHVYGGWLQPPQPPVARQSAVSEWRALDRLQQPRGRDWPRALQPLAHSPSSAWNGQVIAPAALLSQMLCLRLPPFAAIAAANPVAAVHHDDSHMGRRVLTCAVPDTSECSRLGWRPPVGCEQRRAVYFNTC